MSTRCKLLLAAGLLVRADAHFGSVASTSLIRLPSGAAAAANRRTAIAVLRGGGDGIEENPDYEEGDGGVETLAEGSDAEEDVSDGEGDVEEISDDDGEEEEEEDADSDSEAHAGAVGDATDDELPATAKRSKRNRRRQRTKDATTISKSKSTSKSRSGSINKRIARFARRNQLNFYILLAIVAFRREILEFALKYRIIPTALDPSTGARRIAINWTTDVPKLILVAEVVRRYFLPTRGGSITSRGSDENNNGSKGAKNNTTSEPEEEQTSVPEKRSPPPILPLVGLALIALLPILPRNVVYLLLPLVLRLLSGMPPDPDSLLGRLMPGGDASDLAARTAYVPRLEQHFAFEQLNERYYRDWGAYRKAYATQPMVSAAASDASAPPGRMAAGAASGGRIGASSLASLLFSGRKATTSSSSSITESGMPPMAKYPHVYNNGTVIVLDMTKLDTQASQMATVRDQVSFLIHLVQSQHGTSKTVLRNDTMQTSNVTANATVSDETIEPQVEVVVLLESPGGGVSQYGLAASHLQRLRSDPNIMLTICIDTVAASGGYMMACMASPGQLYCAPFAMVGSIGVIGQSLNIQKTLESYGVRPYVFRGGKMKNPVGMVGHVTKEGVASMQQMIDRVHDSFRDHVASARKDAFEKASTTDAIPKPVGSYFQLGSDQEPAPSISHVMDQVATGDVFLGMQALKLGLVDRLITSDEYISERIRQGARVLKMINYHRPVGLSGLLGPSPMGMQPSIPSANGLISLLKRLVMNASTALLAWASDEMSSSCSAPTVLARSVD